MKKKDPLILYKKYHIDRDDERLGLFLEIAEKFNIRSVLYPGSFVHIAPSFVFPRVFYIDSYKKAKFFFEDPSVYEYICKNKIYKDKPEIFFQLKNYMRSIEAPEGSFDLLISQYAGFVSQGSKKYLKVGGILLTNNSHGDASMASIDKDYKFIGIVNKRSGGKYTFSDKNLNEYFIPKKHIAITKEYLEKIKRGIGYTKYVTDYVFKRVK